MSIHTTRVRLRQQLP